MLKFRGVVIDDLMMIINNMTKDPYDAVETVFVNSAYPLKEDYRIAFIAENIDELVEVCAVMNEDWESKNQLMPAKKPTHPGTATLQ